MTDRWTMSLKGIEVFARHGVYEAERKLGQRFVVDIDLELADCPGGETDELDDTVNYASLADVAAEVVSGPPVALLEHLASKLADAALRHDERISAISVTVRKPHVAIPHQIEDARVTLRRERG